jgi:hypothetical protein
VRCSLITVSGVPHEILVSLSLLLDQQEADLQKWNMEVFRGVAQTGG